METYSPRMVMTAELTTLRNLYEDEIAQYFNSPSNLDGIEKPSYCPDQIRQYNSRSMIANFKQMIKSCFFKHQFHTVRSFAQSFLPDDMDDKDKRKRANNMTKFMCSQINSLVFSATYKEDVRLANANDGQLPGTSTTWGDIMNDATSEQRSTDQEATTAESDYDEEMTDDERDVDVDDDNVTSIPFIEEANDQHGTNQIASSGRRRRITLGERWCQEYIPTTQMRQYINSHRRALGVLLVVKNDADRRLRQLRGKHLKKANYLLKSKLRYLEFLRHMNSISNNKRFQLFPEYKMTTKHFKLDSSILGALRMTSINADRESGKISLSRRRRPRLNRNLNPDGQLAPVNPWLELFDLQEFGVDEDSPLSMTTDGFGVCLSIGEENQQDDEDDDEEEENQDEEVYPDEDFIDIRNFDHGLFKLEKLDALPLAWTLRDVDYIGVDPGLKSVVTAVRSDDPNDKLEITSGIH